MITILTDKLFAPLRRPWKNSIAVGRAYDLTRSDLLEHLRWLQREIGFRSCRFHAVFRDDMAVVRWRQDGSLIYPPTASIVTSSTLRPTVSQRCAH